MESKTTIELISESADKMFDVWEKRTSEYAETLLKNPTLLNATGLIMSIAHRNRISASKTFSALWKNLNLPNKDDQERTLHLLNELEARLIDIEAKLETAEAKKPEAVAKIPKSVAKPVRANA